MSEFATLRAPAGTDEANHAGVLYRTVRGLIRAPREVAHHFIGRAGFELVPDDPSVETVRRIGVVKLKMPAHMRPSSFTFSDGAILTVGIDGIVEVASAIEHATDPGIEGVEYPARRRELTHVAELVRLGAVVIDQGA